jgi:hypothetical protein
LGSFIVDKGIHARLTNEYTRTVSTQ